MFGNVGKVIEDNCCAEIEYIDIRNLGAGWVKMNYNNRSEIDLKTHVNILEISNDLVLIFGGFIARDNVRNMCVLNKERREILKCDAKMMEEIRSQCKYNGKLGKLMSTISAK